MSQLALFPDQVAGPRGLRSDFVSSATERDLIARIGQLPLQPFQFGAFEGNRQVKSFGFRYNSTAQNFWSRSPFRNG